MAIIQEHVSGCGIASVANIVGRSYAEVNAKANSIGIFATDEALHSDTEYVRSLLQEYGIELSNNEFPFNSWEELPDIALLSIKHHYENGRPLWHWVVFKREQDNPVVLDSAAYLNKNERTDFEVMQPKWFIAVSKI